MQCLTLPLGLLGAMASSSAPPHGQHAAQAHAQAHALRGIELAASNRQAEAVDALERALALHPTHAPTHVNLGLVWEQLGLPMAAFECYAEALSVDPASAAAYARMGELLAADLGERAMAEDALRTAVELEPTRADCWSGLGKLLHARGELDAAGGALDAARALTPSDGAVAHNLAT
eukprot:2497696-Prymnesium_polylepis.1